MVNFSYKCRCKNYNYVKFAISKYPGLLMLAFPKIQYKLLSESSDRFKWCCDKVKQYYIKNYMFSLLCIHMRRLARHPPDELLCEIKDYL